MRHPDIAVHVQQHSRIRNVTGYQIEVQTIEEQHDAQAHRLTREILQLPIHHLPSLAAILDAHRATAPSSPPFHLRTAQLYRLTGTLSIPQIEQLTLQLLVNPVVQQVHTGDYPAEAHVVDVFFHPGVTDTLAESVLVGAQMLGVTGLE